jgi:hypothetical protein
LFFINALTNSRGTTFLANPLPPEEGNINKSPLEGGSSNAAGDVFFAAILFAIAQFPFAIFHLSFSTKDEK